MIAHLNEMDGIVRGLSSSLKVKPSEVDARVKALQSELRAAAKDAEELRSQLALAKAASLVADAQPSPSGASVLVARLDGVDSKGLQSAAVSLQQVRSG